MNSGHDVIRLAIMIAIILMAWAETFFIKPGWEFIR